MHALRTTSRRATIVGIILVGAIAFFAVRVMHKEQACTSASASATSCAAAPIPPSPTLAAPARAATSSQLQKERSILEGKGYTPVAELSVRPTAGPEFDVFHSICTGSADGKCQEVDVFERNTVKVIWSREFTDVLAFSALSSGFMVKAADFKPSDPMCCPSGGTISHVYRWNGQKIMETGRSHASS